MSSQLASGLAAIDAVEIAVAEMEDSGLFVAGRGSAPNAAGVVEMDASIMDMDASIMDGARHRAGAVCALQGVASPVGAARQVLEATPRASIARPWG